MSLWTRIFRSRRSIWCSKVAVVEIFIYIVIILAFEYNFNFLDAFLPSQEMVIVVTAPTDLERNVFNYVKDERVEKQPAPKLAKKAPRLIPVNKNLQPPVHKPGKVLEPILIKKNLQHLVPKLMDKVPGPISVKKNIRQFAPKPKKAPKPMALQMQNSGNADYYKKRANKVNPFQHKFLINEKDTCKKSPYMIVLVHSAPGYMQKREAIRATWGWAIRNGKWMRNKPLAKTAKLLFVLGLPKDAKMTALISSESRQYGDIIQGDFVDSYVNMTLKSLLGLKWMTEFCAGAKILLKCDDDAIINLPYLYDILQRRNLTRSVMGSQEFQAKVKKTGKWSLPNFPFSEFPTYESGAAYVITSDVVGELFHTSEYVPAIFIDDVYVTGILGKIIGIKHTQQQGFAHALSPVPKVCDIVRNRVVTGTRMTPDLLRMTWKALLKAPPCHN